MGSYCDIYLHKDLDETYFVSRNGHKIEHINLTEAKIACEELYNRFDWTNLELVIIQAELMPWDVLGKGLIKNEFEGYLNAHQQHLAFIQKSRLFEKLLKVQSGSAYTAFQNDRKALRGKAFREKYPGHVIRQHSALQELNIPDMEQYAHGINILNSR